jgi:hypothetical protein
MGGKVPALYYASSNSSPPRDGPTTCSQVRGPHDERGSARRSFYLASIGSGRNLSLSSPI